MPKFEEMIEQMGKMSDEERAAKMAKVQEICKTNCGPCPSYMG